MLFRSPPWDSVVYWALALETGGSDARPDTVIAVGMVPVRGGTIRLREGYRALVRPEVGSRRAPPDHTIARRELEEAPSRDEVLPQVSRRIREGVLLVHRDGEVTSLRREFKRAHLAWPSRPIIATSRLGTRSARPREAGGPQDTPPLDLSLARSERGLPAYERRDALGDAIATAEFFLALRLAIGARTLRDLLA